MSDSNVQGEHPLAGEFRFFANMCRDECPLYAALSPRVAEDRFLLDLAAQGAPGQPPVNLLYAAVHDRLLAGADHRLRDFYRSIGGAEPPEDAYPHFRDFCHDHQEILRDLIATRRVQTNEVGRSALLLPAFARASERHGGRPLHLIELGASAGLHLNLDLYRFEYVPSDASADASLGDSASRGTGPGAPASGAPAPGGSVPARSPGSSGRPGIRAHTCGDAGSPVRVRTVVLGSESGMSWLPRRMPVIAARTGIDISVVDLTDEQATRWIEALIWPDHVERIEHFRAAVRVGRTRPPSMIAGDGRTLLPSVVAETPDEVVPCVFHSHAIYQWKRDERTLFAEQIDEMGRGRELSHVSLEWLGDDPGPKLYLTTFRGGEKQVEHLAD
jgi:hypothetical protein